MAKVLNVDDDPGILRMTGMILQKEGFNVVEATCGEDCLEKLKDERPDVVLLDVLMPGIDGWEVCRRIKGDANTKDIPVVIFTVRSNDKDIAKSFYYARAEWHIPRPFEIEELINVLGWAVKPISKIKQEIEKGARKKDKIKKVFKFMNPKLVYYNEQNNVRG